MKSPRYKVIFFDIDGTLVSFRTHRIPESTLQAVHSARQQGVKVFIATGRPLPFIDNLGELEYDGIISFTGAHCQLTDGTVIAQHTIDPQDVERMVCYLEDHAMPTAFAFADEVFTTPGNEVSRQVYQLLNLTPPRQGHPTEALGKPVLQIISFFTEEQETGIMGQVLTHCEAQRWHPTFADVIASGNSKSSGIDSVLQYFGIELSEAMAFGDGGNDKDMLQHVGLGIAMGNASDEVKACARYVTSSVDEDGVARALDLFL